MFVANTSFDTALASAATLAALATPVKSTSNSTLIVPDAIRREGFPVSASSTIKRRRAFATSNFVNCFSLKPKDVANAFLRAPLKASLPITASASGTATSDWPASFVWSTACILTKMV
jgi:hypothetical protein